MSLPAARDLMRCLPEAEQNRLEDQTPTWEIIDVMDAAEMYIQELEIEVATLQEGQKRAATQLEIDYVRAVRVLTNISTVVMNNANAKEDLDFQGDQGSEQREFDHGCYCGRTHFANHLLRILEDKKNETPKQEESAFSTAGGIINDIRTGKGYDW